MSAPKKQWLLDRFLAPVTFGTGPVDRVHRFFARDVWRIPTEARPLCQRGLFKAARLAYLTLRGFIGDACLPRAAALTYITALSVIPLLALAFSVLKGFGLYGSLLESKINPLLDDVLPAVTVTGEQNQLRTALNEILQRVQDTDFGSLGIIGLLIVMWAAMRMLGSVEAAFNQIWGVSRSRTLVRKVTDYLSIVVVLPIFLIPAVGSSGQIRTFLVTEMNLGPAADVFLWLLPKLVGWALFSFVYLVLPNVRSNLRSALLGGFCANVLWQLAMVAHVKFQVGVANYSEFYAGFAAIPVFLVWVQVSWLIVLIGAEVAFAHEHEPVYRGLASFQALAPRDREVLALRAVLRITEAFLDGGQLVPTSVVAAELGMPPRELESVLRELQAGGLVAAAEDGDETSTAFVLTRDPGAVRLKDVADALRKGPDGERVAGRTGGDGLLDRLLERLEDEQAGSAHNVDLRELVRRTRREADAAAPARLASEASEPGVQPS